jgi:hypothetical protein
MPAAKVTPCCSAMPTSNTRAGKRLARMSSPVPSGMAAVTATMRSSARGLGGQALAETPWYRLGALGVALGLRARRHVELATP